jgi:hypothetical protein
MTLQAWLGVAYGPVCFPEHESHSASVKPMLQSRCFWFLLHSDAVCDNTASMHGSQILRGSCLNPRPREGQLWSGRQPERNS